MAWTTTLLTSIYRAISGTGDASLLVLERADGTGVVAQAGGCNGLAIEGVTGGEPVPVSGTLNATLTHGTWTPATVAAAADEGVISAAPCTLRRLRAANSHAADTFYLMIFDSATVPADSTAPRVVAVPIAAGQTVELDFGGLACVAGLSWAASSTVNTKTVTALTSCQVSAEIL